MDHYIKMKREPSGVDHTYGKINFYDFECLTIEDEAREVKVDGETRIWANTYEIILRNAGGLNEKYKKRFPNFHKGMLHLQDVKDFTWIYIHCGVTDDHTDGCIIVGKTKIMHKGQPGVGYSSAAYTELYKMIVAFLEKGDRVFITIED